MIESIVLDIEGTTSSLTHVHDHLFPYARRRLPDWLPAHAGDPAVAAALVDARRLAGLPDADVPELAKVLVGWIDEDRKAAPLKTVQGLIWAEGYARGELRSHVYDDVPAALRAWTAAGRTVYIFSSGSVLAQREWFGHAPQGDLRPYLAGHFDTVTAGPKKEPGSYRVITDAIGTPPDRTLFLSDVLAELDAAVAAGWHAVGVRRDDAGPLGGPHPTITTFADVRLPD